MPESFMEFAYFANKLSFNCKKHLFSMKPCIELSLQKKLFQSVNSVLPKSYSLVNTLSEMLGLSIDSTYRRIRGETFLTIDEVAIICHKFNISFDSLLSNHNVNTVTFNFSSMTSEEKFVDYLKSIARDVKMFAASNNSLVIYAAEDIPLPHSFRIPHLSSFKTFYWLRSVVHDEKYMNMKFNRNLISGETIDICKEIFNSYSKVPTIEIWSDVTQVSFLMQIRYIWESGLFENKEEALYVCSLARDEFDFVEKQAEKGQKLDANNNPSMDEGSYMLYHSDIEIGNNTIFVKIEDHNLLMLTHNTLNRLTTSNARICNETERWLKNLIKKSTLLSGVGEKQRFKFFRNIRNELKELEDSIKES